MADDLERVSVTLPADLLAEFDGVVDDTGFENRSEAVRNAVRTLITDVQRERGERGLRRGTVVLMYDHHDGDVVDAVLDIQHRFEDTVVAVQHVHLSDRLCLETLVVDGDGADVAELVDGLRSVPGVKQARLAVVDTSDDD